MPKQPTEKKFLRQNNASTSASTSTQPEIVDLTEDDQVQDDYVPETPVFDFDDSTFDDQPAAPTVVAVPTVHIVVAQPRAQPVDDVEENEIDEHDYEEL